MLANDKGKEVITEQKLLGDKIKKENECILCRFGLFA